MRETLQTILNTVSGERAFHSVEEIAAYHRIQASPGYREAAMHVKEKLLNLGLDARIKSYPADGKTWFLTQKMFKEWDCQNAYLHLENEDMRLADFSENNLSIIQRSYPCDYRNQPLDIVLLDSGNNPENYKDLDLNGKLIFVRDDFNAYVDWAVKEKGAVGIITDHMREVENIRTRYDLYDSLNYTSFWWKHTDDEPETFGFVLTPRLGDQLASLCCKIREAHEKDSSKDAYPKATCFVDASIYDGEIEVVETFLQGESDEEVLIVSHLCHPRPSANDNTSGVAAAIEALTVINRLISDGKLKKLKRSIRMIFIPEFTGTFAYLAEIKEKWERIKAGINLDMVGGRQTKGYGPLTIWDLPYASPSFIVNLASLVMDEVKYFVPGRRNTELISMVNTGTAPFSSGSDHYILSDPSVSIPTLMLGQWPDFGYHTGADTTDVVDPFILHKSASICAGFIYLAANLSENDVLQILNKSRFRYIEKLSCLLNEVLEEEIQLDTFYEKMNQQLVFFTKCNESIIHYLSMEGKKTLEEKIQKENDFLEEILKGYLDKFLSQQAPDFVYLPPEIPEAYQFIPVRKFEAPLLYVEDYVLTDSEKMAMFKKVRNEFLSKLQSAHKFVAVVGYYMDGNRTVWEIARETVLETDDGNPEIVLKFIELLKSFDLIDIVKP